MEQRFVLLRQSFNISLHDFAFKKKRKRKKTSQQKTWDISCRWMFYINQTIVPRLLSLFFSENKNIHKLPD